MSKFINVEHDDYMVYDDMIANIKAIVIELADLRIKLDQLEKANRLAKTNRLNKYPEELDNIRG